MIKKLSTVAVAVLLLSAVISCEKDFNDIGSDVVNNDKFTSGEFDLEIRITSPDTDDYNLTSVRADNLGASISEYWLGGYKTDDYKDVNASIIAQLEYKSFLKLADVKPATENEEIDSIYHLDNVVLKLPYVGVVEGRSQDEINANAARKYKINNFVGDTTKVMMLKVFQNTTFLTTLDPDNTAEGNEFESNFTYGFNPVDLLNADAGGYAYRPTRGDTIYRFTRTYDGTKTFNDSLMLSDGKPFIHVELDKAKMKTLIWDKLGTEGDPDFDDNEAFQNYFRGLVIMVEDVDGALMPINLTGSGDKATVEFYYTISRYEKVEGQNDLQFKDSVPSTLIYNFSGIRNSKYVMGAKSTSTPDKSVAVQGTAGTMAKVEILGLNLATLPDDHDLRSDFNNNSVDDLEEMDDDGNGYLDLEELESLRSLDKGELLVTDALLETYINQTIDKDTMAVPQRLYVYQNKIEDGSIEPSPTHLSDAYEEASVFGGFLINADKMPEKYSFRITDYFSDLLDGTTNEFDSPLVIKVYNSPTDQPIVNGNGVNLEVRTYNWNPRGVTLLNEDATHGEKKAKIKISYSREK